MSSGPVVESEDSSAHANLAVTSGYSEGPPSHLAVTVLRATGLRAKGFHGGSNPYVVVQLGQRRITTPVIHGTLTPRWNCELTFPLPSSAPRDGTTEALTLTIHHRRPLLALPDKFLGTVSFRLEDVIKKQDGNKGWFVLNSESRKKPKKRGHVEVSFRLHREHSSLPSHSQPLTQTQSQPLTLLSHSTSLSQPSNLPSHSQSLTQPHSQSHFQPSSICTKSHISRESDTRCSPPSVQSVVKHREPIHPSCGKENSGVLDSVPLPSAPASPQKPADGPDCVSITTADCSNTIRPVSYSAATGDLEDGTASIVTCETGDLEDGTASIVTCETGDLEDGQEASLLDPGGGHSSHQGPLEETSTAGSTIGTQTSSSFQMFPFQHSQSQGRMRRVSFRSSFRSRLRRLRYRLDSGEDSGERRTLRLQVCPRVFSRSTSPPYDRFPKIDVSERPQGFLARLFPCLDRR
ncbi:uncharacterized protein LOC121545692 [Coregonus clupeaformis]|uniref:uncharacterized protein LOC121545692 n=1 Tax=Coregonus clupeaformis TaxID=59861 RepID=UPI001BDF83AB|nr:uncharacterized protein LOC121545692 [Coregonus clupeaformis]